MQMNSKNDGSVLTTKLELGEMYDVTGEHGEQMCFTVYKKGKKK